VVLSKHQRHTKKQHICHQKSLFMVAELHLLGENEWISF